MKLSLVFVLAKYFSEKARRQFGWRELFASGLLTIVPSVLVFAQPDFGSASILVGIWVVFVFFAGIRLRHALFLSVLSAMSALSAWFFFFADYQKERIMIFFDPARDPLGHGYNVLQAIIAIGSGKFFGRGLGFGSQSQLKFLPESQTDFIFAVIAEELGFIGVIFVLGAFVLLFLRLFHLMQVSRDDYTSYLLIGFGAILFIQVVVNVGMNLGLLPVTGIALPFVSYGGSSLLMSLAIVGLMQSIAVRSGSKVS
ncbi:MAG: FtsW/RodA/SpoVE family cell cycle protein [Patescibacteria group bacterium]